MNNHIYEQSFNTKDQIFVILGIDSHIERIQKCVSTITKIYGEKVNIGIGTFGNKTVAPSIKLKKFCSERGYIFYDSERQNFLTIDHTKKNQGFVTTDREFHVCEILGNITISKHFYDLGYKEVYLLHNDLFVIRDFLPLYRRHMTQNWAFIAPYTCSLLTPKLNINKIRKIPKENRVTGGYTIIDNKRFLARITQTIIIFNPQLIQHLFSKYKNQKRMFMNLLKKYDMHGDIALLQLFDEFEGFVGNPITQDTVADTHCLKNTSPTYVINNQELTHIHGVVLYKQYFSIIDDIITKIKDKEKC